MSKALVFIIVLCFWTPVFAGNNCDQPNPSDPPGVQANLCLGDKLDAADRTLNERYKKLLKKLGAAGDNNRESLRAPLVKAQRAWISYRDSHCDEVAAWEADGGSGSGIGGFTLNCLLDATAARTQELEGYIDQVEQ